MNLDSKLDKSLKNDLSDCSHPPEPTDLVWLHLEQKHVWVIDQIVHAGDPANTEQESHRSEQSRIQNEDLVHEHHVDEEHWTDRTTSGNQQN